ncbi:MAG: 50S ribosomal protein L15 [Desulfobacterales bacterium GWB2_56_26]|nr:MAG: 50S ribosomal protein L15 [Desulfobacterales bacterium GWB2_56_26]
MLSLAKLAPQAGSTKQRKRVGRGPGSGHGKTAGRGHKGFKARSGSGVKPGFEGGQMPLQRRIPKRGFTNVFKKEYALVSLSQLNEMVADVITVEVLIAARIVKKGMAVKVLANGEITKAIKVQVDKISASAKSKIEAAGGSVVIEKPVEA